MNRKILFIMVAMITVALAFAGCGSSGGDSSKADDKAQEVQAEETAEEENEADTVSPFVGNWMFYSMESKEGDPSMTVKHEDLDKMKEKGFDYAGNQKMTVREDGTYKMIVFGDVYEGKWTDNGDNTGTIDLDGGKYGISIKDDHFVFDMSDNVTEFERTDETIE